MMPGSENDSPKWPYYVAAAAFLTVGYWMGWIAKDILVVPSFVAALACLALAHLDRFKSFKAAGVEAVLKDAKAAVRESRDLALVTSKMLLSLVKRTGRIGSFSPMQQTEIRHAVDRVLAQFDATESERREAYADWEMFEKFDYVAGILGGSQTPTFKVPAHAGKTSEWKAFRRRASEGDFPSADELLDFLKQHEFLDQDRAELVEDYRYYLKHGKHRRPDVWARRDEWEEKRLGGAG